ncbi:MAG TPA: glycosyltransferase 87 family protein [Stellaceae bacterium]|nr:glycosyltransferase 87 family protein [Stellaceae bacterium]
MIGKLGAALLFWIAVGLIQKFDWGRGGAKAVVLLAVLAATPLVLAAIEPPGRAAANRAARLLAIAALALLALQSVYALSKLRHPSLIDAATTTLAAGELLRQGHDPYAAAIDAVAASETHETRLAGYKYLPLTIAAYLPLGQALGERGIVLTNLLLHLLTVWLIYRLGTTLGGSAAGWLAALLYLSLPLVPFQLFAKGDTDAIAVVPLLGALLLIERNPLLSGLCLGLSLSAKLLPAGLLLPCCLPETPRARLGYALGVALGVLPILPFLLWSPSAFVDNILLFNLQRPPDSTSWLFWAPPSAAFLAHVIAAAFLGAALVFVWRRRPDLATRTALAVMLILAAILAGPAAHHNYQLWWLPLAAVLLGAALTSRRLPMASPAF